MQYTLCLLEDTLLVSILIFHKHASVFTQDKFSQLTVFENAKEEMALFPRTLMLWLLQKMKVFSIPKLYNAVYITSESTGIHFIIYSF